MKKITKLEDYRKKKTKEKNQKEDSPFREVPEEEFAEILDQNGDIQFYSNDFDIYDDEFIQKNAEHIVHNNIPYCTLCDTPLREGDRVDSMWPIEYGNNICSRCQDKMPKKIKKKGIINLDKLEIVLVEEDYEKIIDHLDKKDIHNIEGHRIITEDLYNKISYKIING